MLLLICLYLYVVINMFVSLCLYLYAVISMFVLICCYLYVCIYMLLFICCYLYVVISMFVSLCLPVLRLLKSYYFPISNNLHVHMYSGCGMEIIRIISPWDDS